MERLRTQYESRLAVLRQRRDNLQSQLQKVEAEIQAASQEGPAAPAAAMISVPAPARGGRRGKIKLPALIVQLIQEAGRPLTATSLAEELRRRKIPTKSKKLPQLVQVRMTELRQKGILAPAENEPGYIVVQANGQTAPATRAKAAGKAAMKSRHGQQPSLREVVTRILRACKAPIKGSELARKVLASGYKSNSKNFADVVRVGLRDMDHVEHVRGEGYRLKR
jgi:hypothetical protein